MSTLYFVTITGIDNYYGKKPFKIGRVFQLIKDRRNQYDGEAIMAYLPFIEKIGYVANSVNTVYRGTLSAGRLYDKIGDYAFAKVMFITHTSVIAVVLDKEEMEAALAARTGARTARTSAFDNTNNGTRPGEIPDTDISHEDDRDNEDEQAEDDDISDYREDEDDCEYYDDDDEEETDEELE